MSGEKKGDSFLQQKAKRVEKHNRGLAQERGGIDERIERTAGDISWIEQELRQVERAIREMDERLGLGKLAAGAGSCRRATWEWCRRIDPGQPRKRPPRRV